MESLSYQRYHKKQTRAIQTTFLTRGQFSCLWNLHAYGHLPHNFRAGDGQFALNNLGNFTPSATVEGWIQVNHVEIVDHA